ncbi:MAG: carboxymuconolactone decarboxylase family protein [Gammaproteobacteria bacterium]|nr:MAG: carboxymuconolactone decarboxylase family protein [Gammaproteobacteria bacterium]
MLNDKQQRLYEAFYTSTHEGEHLDSKTETLVGLAAAMAMDCAPCTNYYMKLARQQKVSKEEISEVLAKVMSVAAGQKRLQMLDVMEKYKLDLSDYK